MPVYEYECTGPCGKIFAKQRSIKEEDPGYTCETCNVPLKKVYYSAGVIFNGSGFYNTDNRKK